ncbi:MAG: hypothetical protein A2107_03050 [Verrucomicrobia bacterium GWF2_62_7]|nr:MAG: hypothetical protein A2107_03050 [Verrucomicrobia bacterium GWF2_62_7]
MKTTNGLFAWIATGCLFTSLIGLPLTETQAASRKPVAPPKQQQISGSVVSCDEKVLTVRVRKGEEIKFNITIETKFGEKGAIKSAADFKPGNHVRVTYVRSRGERTLKQVVHVVKHIN